MDDIDGLMGEGTGANEHELGIRGDVVEDNEASQQRTIAETESETGGIEDMDDEIGEAGDGNEKGAEEEGDEDEDDVEEAATTSPIMRSAFVAKSALPDSPLAHRVHQSPTGYEHSPEIQMTDHSSDSSAAQQLLSEGITHTRPYDSDDESEGPGRRLAKRPRTKSRAQSGERREPKPGLVLEESSDSSPEPLAEGPKPYHNHLAGSDMQDVSLELAASKGVTRGESDDEEDDADEYAVQAILAHSHQDGVEYYLVQWEGYDEATDWLPESSLGGATEMVAEFNARMRPGKKREFMS
jgi:hypothetical protein